LTLQQIDGGLGYYGQFTNPLPTSPSFFPIGVWGAYAQEANNRNKDAAVGINVYVWAADAGYYPDIAADRRFHVITDESNRTNIGSVVKGWMLGDEIDMTQGPNACPGAIDALKSSLPNDGRFRYANYGKGPTIWSASGWAGHTDASSRCFINAQDITSTDLYWHTDPNETNFPQSQNSWGYGWTMDRQRMFDASDGVRKPQWGFVEVTNAMGLGAITPAEIRGAVWHTLIKGARGIIYFQHDFSAPCDSHHALRETGSACYGAVINMVTSVNAQIKNLARVLNSPFVNGGRTVTGPVEHMLKWNGANLYMFAAGRNSGSMTFSMPCIGNATATVVNESRTIPVANGAFTDTFADGNAVHIYRIDRGSKCGLS
jgi:hypothetical protein